MQLIIQLVILFSLFLTVFGMSLATCVVHYPMILYTVYMLKHCLLYTIIYNTGKTRPQTGVIFKDPEIAAETTQSKTGDVTYELVSPDGSYVIVSFSSTIPLSKSSTGIECRDTQGGYESSFVQVCKLLSSGTTLDKINPGIIIDNIFGQAGKFGMYGSPTDVRVKKLPRASESSTDIYQATFTTLTPAMRER